MNRSIHWYRLVKILGQPKYRGEKVEITDETISASQLLWESATYTYEYISWNWFPKWISIIKLVYKHSNTLNSYLLRWAKRSPKTTFLNNLKTVLFSQG